MECFASLVRTGYVGARDLTTATEDSENEQRQLIKRVGDFEADQNQRCDHQIKAEMHERLKTRYFAACADFAPDTPTTRTVFRDTRALAIPSYSTGTEGLRRRG